MALPVRTRFAPSPTGYLHIGGVRTALFNWLFARRHGGQFLLRIDDTDQERNVDEALAPILHGFRWLGIDWDEGPEVGGPYAPYYQSQRLPRYQAAVDKLLAGGFAYRDYATHRGNPGRACRCRSRQEAVHLQPPLDGGNRRTAAPLRSRRPQGRGATEHAARGHAGHPRPDPRRRRIPMGPRARSRHPARRRHAALQPGQRGRRLRFRNLARHPRGRASLEHAAADVHRPIAGLSAAGVRPRAVRGRAGQQEQAEQAKVGQIFEKREFARLQRARAG